MNERGARAWLLVAGVAATVAIVAGSLGERWWPLFMATKPLATIAIGVWACGRGGGDGGQRRWVLVGLALSLVGDVALLWPKEGFVPGLAAFLLAHLAYIAAFSRGVGFARRRVPFVFYACVAGSVLTVLWPHVGAGLRPPVLAYVVCLAAMAAQAAAWWLASRGDVVEGYAQRAALGGLLFVVSDASLAINKFMQPVPMSTLVVLSTYWAAQMLIAASLRPRPG